MSVNSKSLTKTENTILLVVTGPADERLLRRAGSVASMLGGDLQVYCPSVQPVVPHSDVTPGLQADMGSRREMRERARRIAAEVQFSLCGKNIDGYVQTGVCPSVTEGILDAAAWLKPDLVIVPNLAKPGVFDRPYGIDYEAVWTNLGVPIWLVNSEDSCGDAVAGLVSCDRWRKGRTVRDQRVARAAIGLASQLESEAHLLCCMKSPPALSMATEAMMAPTTTHTAEESENAIAKRLYALAEASGIPSTQLHMYRGSACIAVQELSERLGLGLVVTSHGPRGLLGRLAKRWPVSELVDLRCDLLVLGDDDWRWHGSCLTSGYRAVGKTRG